MAAAITTSALMNDSFMVPPLFNDPIFSIIAKRFDVENMAGCYEPGNYSCHPERSEGSRNNMKRRDSFRIGKSSEEDAFIAQNDIIAVFNCRVNNPEINYMKLQGMSRPSSGLSTDVRKTADPKSGKVQQ
jgi:hypothetical protein